MIIGFTWLVYALIEDAFPRYTFVRSVPKLPVCVEVGFKRLL